MIVAIFVVYRPNVGLLLESIESLIAQVDSITLVSNSPESDISTVKDVTLIQLEGNMGIAAAQNIGIISAINSGSDYVLLSDQDTIYPSDYVAKMLPVLDSHPKCAVVVPQFFDKIKKRFDPFIVEHRYFFKRYVPRSGCHQLMQAISSGQIIKTSAFSKVGYMNEALFIDWVDLEWCWRARSSGYSIIGNADVFIWHSLGDYTKKVGSRTVNLRSPSRHYYITRNAFYLALYSRDLDRLHRLNLLLKAVRYCFAFPLIGKSPRKQVKAVVIGALHGLVRKLGGYEL